MSVDKTRQTQPSATRPLFWNESPFQTFTPKIQHEFYMLPQTKILEE
jgi:hypothetical protein